MKRKKQFNQKHAFVVVCFRSSQQFRILMWRSNVLFYYFVGQVQLMQKRAIQKKNNRVAEQKNYY